MNIREAPGRRGWCVWPELFGRVGLGLLGEGAQATEKGVKITAWWGGPRHVLFQACREGSGNHCCGLNGGGAGPNMLCPRTTKLTKKRVKKLMGFGGGGGGGLAVGCR